MRCLTDILAQKKAPSLIGGAFLIALVLPFITMTNLSKRTPPSGRMSYLILVVPPDGEPFLLDQLDPNDLAAHPDLSADTHELHPFGATVWTRDHRAFAPMPTTRVLTFTSPVSLHQLAPVVTADHLIESVNHELRAHGVAELAPAEELALQSRPPHYRFERREPIIWGYLYNATFFALIPLFISALAIREHRAHRARRASRWRKRSRCPHCGYDLSTLDTWHCPECGKSVGAEHA